MNTAHSNKLREVQLTNNFGLKDAFVISEAETVLTVLASAEGAPKGDHDLEHLKAIHKHLLGDMYPWAGELRKGDHWVGDNIIKSPSPGPVVEVDIKRVLADLKAESFQDMTQLQFADTMANYYNRIYRISPFPDGNARAARMLIDSVATSNDMMIDWAKLPNGALNAASAEAVAGNPNKMKSLMRHIVGPTDLFDLYSLEGIKSKSDNILQASGLSGHLIPATEGITTEHVTKLARHAKIEVMKSLEEFASTGKSAFRDWDATSIQHQHLADQSKESGSSKIKEVMAQMENYTQGSDAPTHKAGMPRMG